MNSKNFIRPAAPGAAPIPLADPLEDPAEKRRPREVRRDLSCVVCGYNLRGLPEDGECSECGAQVERSLMGGLLRYSAPGYVAALYRGALFVEVSVVAAILGVLATVGVFVLLETGVLPRPSTGGAGAWGLFSQLFYAAASGLGLYGWWLLSSSDPGQLSQGGGMPRRIVRIGVGVQAAAVVGGMALSLTSMAAAPTPAMGIAAEGCKWAALGAWGVTFLAAMRYLGRLATRLPDGWVEGRAKTLFTLGAWLLGAYGGATLLLVLIMPSLMAGTGPAGALGGMLSFLFCVGLPAFGIGYLVALVMYVQLLDRLRVELKEQRHVAESLSAVTGGMEPM